MHLVHTPETIELNTWPVDWLLFAFAVDPNSIDLAYFQNKLMHTIPNKQSEKKTRAHTQFETVMFANSNQNMMLKN